VFEDVINEMIGESALWKMPDPAYYKELEEKRDKLEKDLTVLGNTVHYHSSFPTRVALDKIKGQFVSLKERFLEAEIEGNNLMEQHVKLCGSAPKKQRVVDEERSE
jgi:hypothetical protein